MKKYNLFLDDIRTPKDCMEHIGDPRYINLKWVIVRSHDEFIQTLVSNNESGEFPGLVSFDHDLHDEHYHPSMHKGVHAYENAYKAFEHPTGRRSAEFLVQLCREKHVQMPGCIIHTMNPAGKVRIKSTINKEK
jgi:hypothetical protein